MYGHINNRQEAWQQVAFGLAFGTKVMYFIEMPLEIHVCGMWAEDIGQTEGGEVMYHVQSPD